MFRCESWKKYSKHLAQQNVLKWTDTEMQERIESFLLMIYCKELDLKNSCDIQS